MSLPAFHQLTGVADLFDAGYFTGVDVLIENSPPCVVGLFFPGSIHDIFRISVDHIRP
jgi:hypothetical protein